MSGSQWDDQNPYASPRSTDGGTGQPRVEQHPNVFAIEPWIPRRDWIDFGLDSLQAIEKGLLFAIFSAAMLVGLSVLEGLLFLGSPWFAGIVALLHLAAYVVFSASLVLALFWQWGRWMVSRLLINGSGIAFERRAGQPRFLRWNEIRSVRPAARREVFFHAWLRLWPPTREPSKTKSALGHYRIEWADGYVFFPPKDPALFEKAVREFAPDVLRPE